MKKSFLYIFLLLTGFYSCTEFLSPDVEEESIEIISPIDSLYVSDSAVSFWWEENEDAENYRFQLVSPDFDNPSLIFDTLMLDRLIGLSLDEGSYLWRVRIENEGSESMYQTRSFVLDNTAPNIPEPISPISGGVLDINTQLLSWQSADSPINGEIYRVKDSAFIFSSGPTPALLGSALIDFESEKKWDISDLSLEAGKSYSWKIVSIDRAGNRRESGSFSFTLN
ncbi:MAG: hypothetical protein AAFR87_11495 [Bacteroidota bacterium]